MQTYFLKLYVCTLKIRRDPTRHDNIDFQPLFIRTSDVLLISVTVADKGYDSEGNHVLVREQLHAFSVIPARYRLYQYGRHMVNRLCRNDV